MAVHSGKHGIVHVANPAGGTGVKEPFVTDWSLADGQSPEVYRASNTRGGQFVNAGVVDWSGGFNGIGATPLIMPGEVFDFEGYTAPTDNAYGTTGKTYTGEAICDSVTINWSWAGGASLSWSAAFSAASAGLTESTILLDDVTNTLPETMCALAIETGAAGAEVALPNVVSAALTLTADNQTFTNSTTGCFTHRKAGNFNFTFTVTHQEEAETIAKGTDTRFRVYTTASLFWLIEWAHLANYSGLTVNRTSGAIIQKTMNFVMQGTSGSVLGKIVKPDSTVVWPIP